MDENVPYAVIRTEIQCPFGDNTNLPIEIGWVNHDYPMLNINAPEVIAHLRAEHGHN